MKGKAEKDREKKIQEHQKKVLEVVNKTRAAEKAASLAVVKGPAFTVAVSVRYILSKPESVSGRRLSSIQRMDLEILKALESGKLTTLLEVEAQITPQMFTKRLRKYFIRLLEDGLIIHSAPAFYRISHQGRLYTARCESGKPGSRATF